MRAEVGINVMTTNATFGGGEEKGLVLHAGGGNSWKKKIVAAEPCRRR